MSPRLRQRAARLKGRAVWEWRKLRLKRRLAAPATPDAGGEGVILFYTPEAGVGPHLAAQCILARTLQEQGHRVLFARCFALFPRCPVMDVHGLAYDAPEREKKEICFRCAQTSFDMLDAYGLEAVDLRRYYSSEMEAQVQSAMALAPADLREFEFDGVRFGKLCMMDLTLALKVSEFDQVAPPIRHAWLQLIESSVLSYLLTDALCRDIPVKRIVHHNDYSLLMGGRLAAEKHGEGGISALHAGHKNVDRRYLALRPVPAAQMLRLQGAAWPKWRDLCLSPAQLKEGADDLLTRFAGLGSHMFSPAKTAAPDIRAELSLPQDKKLLVAYTSSMDELLSTRMTAEALGVTLTDGPQPFPDQIAWLQALLACAEERDDIYLVIRVHPREGVKRRAGASQHLARLREAFDKSYAHARIIWPDDPVSSYDLAEAADLALVSWSTIGYEMARLGIPALAAFQGYNPFPQDDFLEWGQTPDEYFAALFRLLGQPARLDTLLHAYRWYSLYHLGSSVLLGDLVPDTNYIALPPFHLPSAAPEIEAVIAGGQNILDINFERQTAGQGPDAAQDERDALLAQIRRFLHFFHTGQDSSGELALEVQTVSRVPGADPASDAAGPRLLLCGESTYYRFQGRTYAKVSPLCARLGRLLSDSVEPETENGLP